MLVILEKYLHLNNYFQIPRADLKLQLISHPDYPSLKSITDTLDYFEIDNVAVSVPNEALGELPTSFLALLSHQESNSNVLVTKRKGKIVLQFEDGREKFISEEEFKEMWTGSIIAVEGATEKRNISFASSSVFIFLAVFGFLLLQIVSFSIPSVLLSLLSLTGLYLGYLIVNEEMGIHNKTVAKVCRAVSKSSSCSEVIQATNRKLFGIALSDLSVVFFAAYLLTTSILGVNYSFSIGLAVLGLLVVLYSIYLQAIVLKKWCALCLGIGGVLVLQSVVITLIPASTDFSVVYFVKAIFFFVFTGAVWQIGKPIVVSNYKLGRVQSEFLKFKRNQNLFQTLLNSTDAVDSSIIPFENQISFGAVNPIITIQAVSNPLCGFCTEAFKTYDKLLARHADKIKINLIFSVPLNNPENKATQIASRVIEIFESEGQEKAWQSLKIWFANRDVEKWQGQFGIGKPSDDVNETLQYHRNWCTTNKISYTPATLLDDQLYPKEYQIADLLLLIDDILLEKTTHKELELAGEA